MAYVTTQHIKSSRDGALFAKLFGAIVDFAKRRAAYHMTLSELRGLSDRELADIGIPRCQIEEVARQSVA